MATSSAFSTSNQYIKYKITVTHNSMNLDANSSNVTVSVRFYRTNSYTSYGTGTVSCVINGTTYTSKVTSSQKITSSGIVLFKKTLDIKHNTDGTKSLTVKAKISHDVFSSDYHRFTTKLPTIPRASTIMATNGTIGGNVTITFTRMSETAFTHNLKYNLYDSSGNPTGSGTIASGINQSKYTWKVPTSIYYDIPNEKSCKCKITCTTLYKGSSIGSVTAPQITLSCNASECKPTLAPTVKDGGAISTTLTGNTDVIIKGYNNCPYYFNASAKNGSIILDYKVTCGDKVSTIGDTGALGYVTSNVFKFTVTDSRGYSATKTVTKEMIDYVFPTCVLSAKGVLSDDSSSANITLSINGNYFDGSFGAVDNSLKLQYCYSENDGAYGSWIDVTPTISGNKYAVQVNLTGLDYRNKYTFKARAVDVIKTVNSSAKNVKIIPVFDWSENDFNFNVPVTFSGGMNTNKVLWEGGWYMKASQTAELSEPVSKQANGIVLAFSIYTNDTVQDYQWHCFYVPKILVSMHNGKGHSFNMNSQNYGYIGSKYLYIYNDKIVGNDDNKNTGTANGVTYNNASHVLRYVIGV